MTLITLHRVTTLSNRLYIDVKIYSNYQLLAVVLLSDWAKVLEPSPPYPGYLHPNEQKVYRVSIYRQSPVKSPYIKTL